MFNLKYNNLLNSIQKIQILVADLLAPICIKFGLSANSVTIFRLLVAILIAFIFFGNSYVMNLIGLSLMSVIISLDILDGKIARETNTSSDYGRFLDEFSDQIIMYFVFLNLFIYNSSEILNIKIETIGVFFLIGHSISLNIFRELDALLAMKLSSNEVVYEDLWEMVEDRLGKLTLLDTFLISHIDVHRYSISRFLYTASYLILISILLDQIALGFFIITLFTYLRIIVLVFIIASIKLKSNRLSKLFLYYV